MHAFPNSKYRAPAAKQEDEESKNDQSQRVEQEMAIGNILEKYLAKDIRHSKIGGHHEDESRGDKTRYNFTIEEQSEAQECFRHIQSMSTSKGSKHQICDGRITLRIFYVKQESVFMKYAD